MDAPGGGHSFRHCHHSARDGFFFATSRLTHLEPQQFFGIAFWAGFSINTLAIELWLRHTGRMIAAPKHRLN